MKADNNINNSRTEIKYIWKKGLNFSRPRNFVKLENQPNFLISSQLAVVKKLQQKLDRQIMKQEIIILENYPLNTCGNIMHL